jgi:hypothetical protein
MTEETNSLTRSKEWPPRWVLVRAVIDPAVLPILDGGRAGGEWEADNVASEAGREMLRTYMGYRSSLLGDFLVPVVVSACTFARHRRLSRVSMSPEPCLYTSFAFQKDQWMARLICVVSRNAHAHPSCSGEMTDAKTYLYTQCHPTHLQHKPRTGSLQTAC